MVDFRYEARASKLYWELLRIFKDCRKGGGRVNILDTNKELIMNSEGLGGL